MTGSVRIRFDDDFTAAKFILTVNDGVRVQQVHIHCGALRVNGPILVFLAGFHAPGWDVNGKWIDHVVFTNANIVNSAVEGHSQNWRDRWKPVFLIRTSTPLPTLGEKSEDKSCRSNWP